METKDRSNMLSKKLLPASVECAVCSKFGDFLCERCGETYCSKFCQVSDWREHRRFCMPIPRLMQRGEIHGNGFSSNRMLMDANASFDATDAIGSISEHSAQSDAAPLTGDQIVKITNTLNKMQIEAKHQKMELKSNLPEIVEVMSTPPVTPAKKVPQQNKSEQFAKTIDENANYDAVTQVKKPEPPKARVVLTPPSKKQKNFRPSVKVIQAEMHVTIVHVEDKDHQTVFVVPTAEMGAWKKLVESVNKHASIAEHLKKDPEVDYIVLAKHNSSFLRGLVKKIRTQDKIAKVEFLEYGFTDIVKFADMKCLTEDLVNAPRLVNTITLTGAPEKTDNAHEIVRFLRSLQENGTDLIVKHPALIEKTGVCAHFHATLIDTEKFTKINDQIRDLVAIEPPQNVEMDDLSEPKDSASQKNKQNEIEYVGFSGKNMELLILDNSFLNLGCFSAVQAKDMELLVKNDGFINEKATDIASAIDFHPRNNETCLAQSADDKRWYRASSQNKINDNLYNLMYIDYGNMEKVPTNRIREMQEEFFFPCITSICFIHGLTDVTLGDKAVERLKELIQPYSKVTFDEVQYTGEDAVCKSSKIMDILKSERLI